MKEIREFVSRKARDLRTLLHSDVSMARQALSAHIEKLILKCLETWTFSAEIRV
jgi:hypothetical protein